MKRQINDVDISGGTYDEIFGKKTSASTRRTSAWLVITLLTLALTGAGALAIPIDVNRDKNAQDKDLEAAKRFVGTWKGKSFPEMIVDNVMIFKLEGDRLKGTIREVMLQKSSVDSPYRVVHDEYIPMPELNVEGKTLTWKQKWMLPDHETLHRVTLLSDDEILYESVGMTRSNPPTSQPTLIEPRSFRLRREK